MLKVCSHWFSAKVFKSVRTEKAWKQTVATTGRWNGTVLTAQHGRVITKLFPVKAFFLAIGQLLGDKSHLKVTVALSFKSVKELEAWTDQLYI